MSDINQLIYELIAEVTQDRYRTLYLWGDEEDRLFEEIINNLTKEENEEINDWLWDNIKFKPAYDLEVGVLNDKSKEIVKVIYDAFMNWHNSCILFADKYENHVYLGINDKIVSDRLVLVNTDEYERMIDGTLVDELAEQIELADDFEAFYTREKPTNLKKGLLLNTYIPNGFVIFDRYTEKFVGFINVRNIHLDNVHQLDVCELSYYIYQEYRGKGYATDAVKLVVDAYFDERLKQYVITDKKYILDVVNNKARCIKIYCNSTNLASKKVAEKCGFVLEGVTHYETILKGEPQHFLSYYLDKSTYKK